MSPGERALRGVSVSSTGSGAGGATSDYAQMTQVGCFSSRAGLMIQDTVWCTYDCATAGQILEVSSTGSAGGCATSNHAQMTQVGCNSLGERSRDT